MAVASMRAIQQHIHVKYTNAHTSFNHVCTQSLKYFLFARARIFILGAYTHGCVYVELYACLYYAHARTHGMIVSEIFILTNVRTQHTDTRKKYVYMWHIHVWTLSIQSKVYIHSKHVYILKHIDIYVYPQIYTLVVYITQACMCTCTWALTHIHVHK